MATGDRGVSESGNCNNGETGHTGMFDGKMQPVFSWNRFLAKYPMVFITLTLVTAVVLMLVVGSMAGSEGANFLHLPVTVAFL